ncbi:hypothetical protein DFP72DRAFT_1032121 [Ephemerocybe angulata]|uniref:Uncharacterized protein n=1 Tax=Ephemerocybe angulata TaxID=980116 RepID=A0A8H6M8D2_9AGAR|nr:hypothetical protein DFP72DRAFT_1032121 [Tulosesus angulatus]
MDFLKNLKISDDKEEHQNLATTAPPVAAPAKEESFFGKLANTINEHQTQSTPAPLPQVQAPPPKEESFFHKLGDAVQGKQTPPAAPVQPPAPHKEESFFHKLGDAVQGKQTPPPPPPAPAKPEGLFDKIGSALGHEKPAPPPPQKTDLFSKLTETISGKHEEPAKPQSLGDKLNHALGGGAKGEAEEGKLDKVVDLFQEHVLKEGPQHNESALEQLKDKQIADTIRKTLGIPEKEKSRN